MTGTMHNLLTDPIITTRPLGPLTLPGVLAALARDEINSYPAIRPHQGMFWHMFCVQLAAMALAGSDDIPTNEDDWRNLLRAMTPDHPGDEPWCLVVDDWTKPAFMQAAVPGNVNLTNDVPTPDALDMLITSKNHDLKQAVADQAAPEDWLFALVTLQTGDGYGGKGNQGIVRMNGGSSSRAMVSLATVAMGERALMPQPGAWFGRDLRVLLTESNENLLFKPDGGLGLTWLAPWPENEQLVLGELDRLFIEICRRVRLLSRNRVICALKGNSAATRTHAKQLNGALGDPWAPVHKTENKAMTIGEDGEFDYSRIMDLLGGNWELPQLAKEAAFETPDTRLLLVLQALARDNSKTGGFRSRAIPITAKVAMSFGFEKKRQQLHELGKEQAEIIKEFRGALGYALVTAVASGDTSRISRESYDYVRTTQIALDRYADTIFFPYLWRRFEASNADDGALIKTEFIRDLWRETQAIFDRALPTMPCSSLMRPKAEARARGALVGKVMKAYSDFLNPKQEGSQDAA